MIRTLLVAAVAAVAAVGRAPNVFADGLYPNCKAAAKDGRYNIPSGDTAYGPWLDRDSNGVGCERN
jgi:excalibur calcium-binding domain-containing protein